MAAILEKLHNPRVDKIWNVSIGELGSQGGMVDGVESLGKIELEYGDIGVGFD